MQGLLLVSMHGTDIKGVAACCAGSGRVKEQDLPAKLAPRMMLDQNGAVADGH